MFKTAFQFSWGACFLKKFFLQKLVSFSNSDPVETFLTFRGNFRQFCKSYNLCARGTFWRKMFAFTKLCFPKFCRTESDKCSVGLLKLFAAFPEQNFKERTLPSEKLISSSGLCESFRVFGRKLLAKWSKLHFSCPEEHVSWRIFPLKKLIFFGFRSWSKNFLIVLRNVFDSLKNLQSTFPQKYSGGKRISVWYKSFFFSFEDFDRGIFELSDIKYLSVCSQLHSMYSDEQIDKK